MAKKYEQPDNLQELKLAIRQKQPGRLYFFCGEETFLLHHYLAQLRKSIVDELTETFNFHKLARHNEIVARNVEFKFFHLIDIFHILLCNFYNRDIININFIALD